MLPSLRGQPTPRDGAGQLPALLLDGGQLPYQLPATRQERLASTSAREGILGYVHEANRYEQGCHILGACAVPVRRGSLVDQVARPPPGFAMLDRVVDHSYRGGVDRTARGYQGWLLQGGLEVSWPPPSGPERLVDRLRGHLAHKCGRLCSRVGHPPCLLRRARGRHPQRRHQLPPTIAMPRSPSPWRRDRDARLLAAPPDVLG